MENAVVKVAIPNKGRLMEPALRVLERAGVELASPNGSLFVKSECGGYEVLFARADDVPRYVENGAADCGITGLDMIREAGADVEIACELDFGRCRVSVAGKNGISVRELEGKTIATKLPNIAKRFFESKGVRVKILEVAGATELTPYLGIADAIVDQVSTGNTLARNGLGEIERVLESKAVFIVNKKAGARVAALKMSVEGAVRADGKAYLMLNVGEGSMKGVAALLGGMEAPTMMPLSEKGMYALHSVVAKKGLERLIEKLKRAGAKDILVMGIQRIVP